jgi:hypothetical protein
VGAGVAQTYFVRRSAFILGPLAVAVSVACELAILHDYPGELTWLSPVLIAVGAISASALALRAAARRRAAALVAVSVAMLLGPAIWSVDTLGYAASGTFPAGGPQSAQLSGGPAGGPVGGLGRGGLFGIGAPGGLRPGASVGMPSFAPPAGAMPAGAQPAGAGPRGHPFGGPGGSGGPFGGPGGSGGPFGADASLKSVLSYISAHGGGTLAVESQSSASSEIISQNANVAGIGGFSGRESSVSVAWLARRVRSGAIRWVLAERGTGGPRVAGDTRAGSHAAMSAVAKACRAVQIPPAARSGTGSAGTVYDCAGRAAALAAAV